MTGIYIHIPFCRKKCLYCDFVSFPICGEGAFLNAEEYISALLTEMAARKGELEGKAVDTIFFGGGTPSLLEKEQIAVLMQAISDSFALRQKAEITIEANPESITLDKARQWLGLGINRISIGVQSFCDEELAAIGRAHDSKAAAGAFDTANKAGFENISADLICCLPGQREESLIRSIDRAADLGAEHISCYQLQLEENTPLERMAGRGEIALPDDDACSDMMAAAAQHLEQRGFLRYEVSNFAKPGRECLHNMNYWLRGDYLGLGISAHSFLRDEGKRIANTSSPEEYLSGKTVGEVNIISVDDALAETIMLGMRLSKGLHKSVFSAEQLNRAQKLAERGLLIGREGRYMPSRRGFEVLNSVILFLLEG
ncbi:MAG: radical SAM family heme chaperone HemW [Christensenellales bacterium]|jgi:oxygen-independent coproporphyrinogen-3 oxidase